MTTLSIQGMSCQHCVATVTKALEGVPGVTKVVEVNLERAQAIVEGTAHPAALTSAIKEEGFSATVAP